jgi:ATP-dependent Lhr-like helicase
MLKEGKLKAVVATASLELGIDVGHIELVCQIATPRSIATFLQRVGRAGHSLGLVPKGRLFALSREELIECLAIVRAAREGILDRVEIPVAPLDILAQQIVAAVACEDWDEEALFELCRRAYPYRDLSRGHYDEIIAMLADGIAPERGRYGAYLHRDQVNRRLKARKGARLVAITCGGAIPEVTDYKVVADDENRTLVGTVDEDFAVETNGGDVFLLGNTSWRVKHVRAGEVVVADAHGAPPNIPFWRGEAPGRTIELSAEVARLREDVVGLVGEADNTAIEWLQRTCSTSAHAAEQATAYVAAQYAATGMVPTQRRLLFERFFDESGGMQLVVHAPFGTRINRAWGLAMRKRFCRSFNFELQASADDNGIVLSLGTQHSFPLTQMFELVPSHLARDVLVQAFLAVPFFGTRWRWNITRSLQLKRFRKGQRVPPFLQRMRAEDLLTSVFPAQTACQENVVGDIEVPDQPIVRQTVEDCLHEVADLDGLLQVLRSIETGEIETVGLDSREPSPFAHELLNGSPYSFLDDAPLEERRTRAVAMRRTLSVEALRDIGRLDPEAISQVVREAWPLVRDAEELHDVLLSMGALPAAEARDWQSYFEELRQTGRATESASSWVATERWPLIRAIWPGAEPHPAITVPDSVCRDWDRDEAIAFLVRGRMECIGPTTAERLARELNLEATEVERALATLEMHGTVLRGRFTDAGEFGWCDRRLLARIHRLTLEGLRRQIAPVSAEQFLRFLARHQHLHPDTRLHGAGGVLALAEQLEGFSAPAGHWEKHLLPLRLHSYEASWLDALTFSGQVAWARLRGSPVSNGTNGRPMKAFTRATPITLMLREHLAWLLDQRAGSVSDRPDLGSNAAAAYEAFQKHGALFPAQLGTLLQLVPAQIEDVLGELAAAGLVTSDGYPSLRTLIRSAKSNRRRPAPPAYAGRWTLVRGPLLPAVPSEERAKHWCRLLLRRYGLMFRDLLANESAAPPWHELVRVYRRLEARGEIRGGRFVAGVAGEQYALPDVIAALRSASESSNDSPRVLPATDPLNFTGRIGSTTRVPALPGNSIVLHAGVMQAYEPESSTKTGTIAVRL